ncbi:uncharacterized protein LOC129729091 [Wyeomyia smithii]|uniref:uncharacterized protein LOC129729091 n=1 Tax=Wyeomyia smithii TaxID=174621 RepID=UPI002468208B|nr:uncharacterized protein LOC129729091 [Wyeomyia smithii]
MMEVRESQTAAFHKSKILETLAEYNVSVERIFSVTCDNGANMVAAVKQLKSEIELQFFEETVDEESIADVEPGRDISEELSTEFYERVNLVRCAVHTLQLAILDVVNKSHESVKNLTNTAKKCKNVKYKTNFDHHGASLPPVWSQTRWCGIFKMIESFKTQRKFFEQLASQFTELDISSHWDFINSYHDAFRPLYICTKKMQETHVSLSDFYMAWLMATSEIKKVKNNPFVASILTSLNKRLATLRESRAFKMALFLDPRFNYRGSTVFTAEEKEEIQGFIIDTWKRIHDLESPSSLNAANDMSSELGCIDEFDDYFTAMFGGSLDTDQYPNESNFLQQMQSIGLESRQSHSYNVWDHWLRRKNTHPELYAVTMVVLATPSNQVSVERAFSALSLVLSNLRTGLAEDTLANILLIKLNKDLFQQAVSSLYNWKDVENVNQQN